MGPSWRRRRRRSCRVTPAVGLFEKSHLRLEFANACLLNVLVHALALQAASTRALAGSSSLWRLLCLQRSDDQVIEFRENYRRKLIDLELNLFLTL